jgi:hypothetical protein
MNALYILQAIIGWVDDAGIQEYIEAIPFHLSIMFIKHSPNEFGSVLQLHPYFLAPVLIAEAIECIQASIAIPAVNLHGTSPQICSRINFPCLLHLCRPLRLREI